MFWIIAGLNRGNLNYKLRFFLSVFICGLEAFVLSVKVSEPSLNVAAFFSPFFFVAVIKRRHVRGLARCDWPADARVFGSAALCGPLFRRSGDRFASSPVLGALPRPGSLSSPRLTGSSFPFNGFLSAPECPQWCGSGTPRSRTATRTWNSVPAGEQRAAGAPEKSWACGNRSGGKNRARTGDSQLIHADRWPRYD